MKSRKLSKIVLSTVLIFSIIGVGSVAFADPKPKETNDAIIDKSQKPEIVTAKVSKDKSKKTFSASATPTNTSTTTAYTPWGDNYAVSKSESTIQEDYISAKNRTYNGTDGSLIDSDFNEQNHSSYISAKAYNDTTYYGNDWAVGNHVYKESGYKDVIHETKDNF
ncbi:hypothetical protein [Pontibacillus litoralis]|uniref:XoxI protein n=1 Tax=Pontibacillus litoralis JSM 072002 TaxID=1385512 RepID=A0A0A5G3S1_9BACI|nr:hypothetical protein [Pontibacillus litoralis]KGX85735.1 XoxI protein [Pontibacillus litoralis JSM 072002]